MSDSLTPQTLAGLYATFVVVRRRRFRVEVYKRVVTHPRAFRRWWTCRCAIGALGFETPSGPHILLAKARDPDYLVPSSPWAVRAGMVPGEVYGPEDPRNPIRGAFLRLTDDGVGIHGTAAPWSLGTKASHGCVRVGREDAVWLYHHVDVGAPVYVR